jgi:hypothetical protein
MASGLVLSAKLFRAIGQIVVYHADLEHWLDAIVHALWFSVPSARKHASSRHIPTQLRAEMNFIGKCFAQLPALAAFREDAAGMLKAIEAAADDRHHIAHGYIREWNREKRTVKFVRVWKEPGKEPRGYEVTFTEDGLFKRAKVTKALGGPVRKFAERFRKELARQKTDRQAVGDACE